MSIRGKAAIVGIGELPTKRHYGGRTTASLMTEAIKLAIEDAGLRKDEVDGLMCNAGNIDPMNLAEYAQIKPKYSLGVSNMGSSGATSIALAGAAIEAGYADNVVCVFGGSRDFQVAGGGPAIARAGAGPASMTSEWEAIYGPSEGANTGYGLMKQRHMYLYGSTDAQFAKMAADQRYNAQANPNSAFYGTPITVEDVLNSRFINDPIHILESVMPCSGAFALVVTSAERAKSFPHKPVYLLGAGVGATTHSVIWQNPDVTVTPVVHSGRKALEMSGYSAKDMQMAQMYDCYTVLAMLCLEDAGICKKGEIGEFYQSTDTTYRGAFPVNTDGGQLSAGQPVGNAGGFRHVVEATRQIMGRAGDRQVPRNDLCLVNG